MIQHLPVVVTRFDRPAVDRYQIIAAADLYPVFVGRAFFIDVSDFVSARGIVRLELDTQVSGRDSAGFATPRRRSGARV